MNSQMVWYRLRKWEDAVTSAPCTVRTFARRLLLIECKAMLKVHTHNAALLQAVNTRYDHSRREPWQGLRVFYAQILLVMVLECKAPHARGSCRKVTI